MEATVQITNLTLTHEDLVNILSTATYGNNGIKCNVRKSDYINYITDDSDDKCREDIWADVLLNGGKIQIDDIYSGEDELDSNTDVEKAKYGNLPAHLKKIHNDFFDEDYYVISYEVGLNDIIEGIKKSTDNYNLAEDVISGNGDMYDAYNLIQEIIFGEIVYG